MKEISIPQDKKLAAFTAENGLDPYLEVIKKEVETFVPDLTTAKSRGAIATLSANVRKSKTALDSAGKLLVAELKKQPNLVDAERRRMREWCDEMAIKARKPLTDWEAEQARIAVEEAEKKAAEQLREQVESDHEVGLLLDEKYTRERLDREAQAERDRIAHDEKIKKDAADQARADAQEEIEIAEQEKQDAIEAANEAERQRIAAEERARLQAEETRVNGHKQDIDNLQRYLNADLTGLSSGSITLHLSSLSQFKPDQSLEEFFDASNDIYNLAVNSANSALELRVAHEKEQENIRQKQAKQNAIDAAEQARQSAIDAQKAKEASELAEQKRRDANTRNVGNKRKRAKECLMAIGLTEQKAKEVVMAIHRKEIDSVSIKY